MTNCPVCNKPVDPLRSRFAGVRAGKVVAYCSAECREAAETKPTKQPAELAPLVIESTKPPPRPKTPPAGVPKSKTPPAGVPKPKTPPTGTPKSIQDLESGPVIEIIHEPASGVVTSAKDERVTQPTGKFAKKEVVEETILPRRDGSKTSGGADKASVAGEVNDTSAVRKRSGRPSRPSGKHLTRERKDSTEAKAGWDWLDDEPAEHARPGTVTESERAARPWLIVLLVIVALGAGGYAVWHFVVDKPAKPGTHAEAASPSPKVVAEAPVAVDPGPPQPPTKELALRAAQDLLRKYIQEGSPRVQRLAAGALGRTGDPAAVATLQQAVKAEKVPAARFRLAYELARAGDKTGREALVAGLASPERSDKLDAASRLAHLGDDRAKSLLESFLTIEQHKLRAAEELSRLKDPAADKLLEQVRTNPKSSGDEKATATIALYRAGHAELAADVRTLLEDKSWKAFAAFALAEAKDDVAKPVLVDQVKNATGVRLRAAFALRRLVDAPSDDVMASLLTLMKSEKDQEQIVAAEAILILAGDPQWSEYQ